MSPRLVLLSGYPGSGKTSVANYLVDNFEFSRLGKEDIRLMAYRPKAGQYTMQPLWTQRESILNPLINDMKLLFLFRGFDVVIDTTAATTQARAEFLDTSNIGELCIEKHLIVLKVDREQLLYRRGRCIIEDVWEKYITWEEPETNPTTSSVLYYQNNTPQDLEAICNDLRLRFERKNEIYAPVE